MIKIFDYINHKCFSIKFRFKCKLKKCYAIERRLTEYNVEIPLICVLGIYDDPDIAIAAAKKAIDETDIEWWRTHTEFGVYKEKKYLIFSVVERDINERENEWGEDNIFEEEIEIFP